MLHFELVLLNPLPVVTGQTKIPNK